MDSSPNAKTSLPSLQWSYPSLKKVGPPDESADIIKQQACDEPSFISLQNRIPPPPPLPQFSRKRSLFTLKSPQRYPCHRGSILVPTEVVDKWDELFFDGDGTDVTILTDDGGCFQAHSIVLISASSVFKFAIEKRVNRKGKVVRRLVIPGVPVAAARLFVRLMYSSRYHVPDMEKYALHLLVLSHAYVVTFIKNLCTRELEKGLLTVENVIDVFQLARLCDAPRLKVICFRLIINDFKAVAKTDGWRVMRESNPSLEQELVEAVVDADSKRQEKARKMEEDKVYGQLRDAMEALVHICRDGCRTIGPHDKAFDERQLGPCKFPACRGLESLVRHFASCRIKVPGGCVPCKRMWQLLELHSRMCEEAGSCKVPLCRHFKNKLGHQSKKDENKWRLLVAKVQSAKHGSNAFSLATVSARLEEDHE